MDPNHEIVVGGIVRCDNRNYTVESVVGNRIVLIYKGDRVVVNRSELRFGDENPDPDRKGE